MLTLKLNGVIVPKARPRVTRNGTFIPLNYRQWKKYAIVHFLNQTNEKELTNIKVCIILIGKHNRRCDADNIIGSVLDALVQSKIIKNDNLCHVTAIEVKLQYDSKIKPYTVIEITHN